MKARDEKSYEQSIDENLKRVFDQTLDEGIPDRFKDLLEQLKKQENSDGSKQ